MADIVSDEIVAFDSPPVVEVVAGVSLDAADTEASALMASFWKERLREHFPTLQQQPPYFPPIEQFPSQRNAINLADDFNAAFPSARLWATSVDGNELLQLQPGWFACNWRRVKPEAEYDRWAQRRQSFLTWFEELSNYFRTQASRELVVRQCEVTYINHVENADLKNIHSQAARVLTGLSGLSSTSDLEQVAFQADYVLRDREGVPPYGRLHAKFNPAVGPDGRSELYVLDLTARGAPFGVDVHGALEFMDRGRAAIDHAFVDLTTAEMHEKWGLRK